MDFTSKTILLVEDEAIVALALKRRLETVGFKIIHVKKGQKAIETVRQSPEKIDIILMDIDLGPGQMDGTGAAREILKDHDIPLLFLSAHTEKEIVAKTEQISSYGYVVKGSDNSVLLASIAMAFKLHESNKALKRKEAALSESQERLKRAELITKAGNWEIDLNTSLMVASEGAYKIYGIRPGEWKLSYIQTIPLPEYRDVLDQALRDLIESGKPYDVKFKIRKFDTGEIVDIYSSAVYDKEKKIVFGTIQDITELQRIEVETRRKNRKLSSLLKSSQAMASTLELKAVLQLIIENAVELAQLDTGAIYLIKDDALRLEATLPPLPDEFPEVFRNCSTSEHPHIYSVLETGIPFALSDTAKADFTASEISIVKGRNLGSILYVPIKTGQRAFGILIVGTTGLPREYTDSEIESYKTMSNLAALAIENALLFQAVQHELSERRLAEEALRKSEESLAVTLKSIGDGVIATGVDGKVVLMNPTAEKLCGWKSNEAIDKPLDEVFNIINALTRKPVKSPVEIVLETGLIVGLANHTVLISRQRMEYQIADSAAPILNKEGRYLGVVLVFSDVTEKYLKEEKLRQQEEKYRMLTENASDIITHHAHDGKINYVSPSVKKILGYEPDELTGVYPEELIHPEDSKGVSIFSQFEGKLSDEYVFTYRLRRKDGEYAWFETSNRFIRNESTGRIEEGISVSREITERKRVQDELIRAKKEAEKSDHLKSEFLAQMSHEIRTPINTMLNFISLIKDESPKPLNEELEYSFNAINRSSKRLIRTIDLILDMSQIQTGNVECKFQLLDLENDILKSIIYENSAAALQKGLKLSLCNDYGLVKVNADEYTVTQVFENLINNAIKFTETGTIKVRIYCDSTGHFAVDVSDTGVGISQEYIRQIFSPFTQEEQGYTRRFDGNGLGLALVKRYCELNFADIKVVSRKGSGSTFTVTFVRDNSDHYNDRRN